MKKLICLVLAILTLLNLTSINVKAEETLVNVRVNGQIVDFPDAKPFIDENGRTLVPVRFIVEALGATVGWNEDTQLVTIEKPGMRIALVIGDNFAIVNDGKSDTKKTFDTKSILKVDNGKWRAFVPLRFISETLGAYVGWDEKTSTAIIDTTRPPVPEPQPAPAPPQREVQYFMIDKEFVQSDPVMSALTNIDGLSSVGGQLLPSLVSFTYAVPNPNNNNKRDMILDIEYVIDSEKTVMFNIDFCKKDEKNLQRLKQAIELLMPEYKQELYDLVVSRIGEQEMYFIKFYNKYKVFIKPSQSMEYKPEDRGVYFSVSKATR